jgi:hypothetical protein
MQDGGRGAEGSGIKGEEAKLPCRGISLPSNTAGEVLPRHWVCPYLAHDDAGKRADRLL